MCKFVLGTASAGAEFQKLASVEVNMSDFVDQPFKQEVYQFKNTKGISNAEVKVIMTIVSPGHTMPLLEEQKEAAEKKIAEKASKNGTKKTATVTRKTPGWDELA